jgi:hypothetical protein
MNPLSHVNMSGLMIAGWQDETSNLTEVSLYCTRLYFKYIYWLKHNGDVT